MIEAGIIASGKAGVGIFIQESVPACNSKSNKNLESHNAVMKSADQILSLKIRKKNDKLSYGANATSTIHLNKRI